MKKSILALSVVGVLAGGYVATNPVSAEETKYSRSQWKHWVDVDKDCQDTRQEVLIAESLIPVTMDERNCKVTKGRWFCQYTGKYYTNPSLLDIDHLIPLKHVHLSGGSEWNQERKKDYANFINDPRNLTAVYRGANRQKGAKAPHEWMPSFKPYWCSYLEDWVHIKYKWNLKASTAEQKFIEKTLTEEKCFQ